MSWSNYPQYPPPGGPEGPGGGWEGPPPRRRTPWAEYVAGALVGAPVVAFLSFYVGGLLRGAGSLATIILIGVPVGLVINARTRPWGIGILIGYALWMIVAAGACVVLLAVLAGSESH